MSEDRPFQKILVATDFSPHAEAALRQAIEIARGSGGEVAVIHVLRDIRAAMAAMPADARWELVAGDIDAYERHLRRGSDEQLERLLAAHRSEGVSLRSETLLGTPFAELIRAVHVDGYDLVVAGTRGLSGLKRLVLGSTAARLVRNCPAPVLITPEEPRPVRVVLVATDFSPACALALRLAGKFAACSGAAFHVVHVLDAGELEQIADLEGVDAKELRARRRAWKRAAEERLREFVTGHAPAESAPQFHLPFGQAEPMIHNFARRLEADLVVVGSVARSGFPGLWFGNTAERLLHSARYPILTVKPEEFVSPIEPPWWSLHAEKPAQESEKG